MIEQSNPLTISEAHRVLLEAQLKPAGAARRAGAVYCRELPNDLEITVYIYGANARLCIGPQDSLCYDDAWCYSDHAAALVIASTWDGEGDAPNGWHRHINTGRRREGGDPSKEFIHW